MVHVLRRGHLLEERAVLGQDRCDKLSKMRLTNVFRDAIVDRFLERLDIVAAAFDQVEKVITILDVFLGGWSNAQDVDLQPVAQVVPGGELD